MARAPDVVAPPPGHPRFPALDALRAVAALGVLVSHAAYVAGASQNAWYGSLVAQGTAGVTVFFVLSGFLLYRPFLAADADGLRAVHTRDYLRRRLLRIVPAYWLALTVIGVWLSLKGVFGSDFWRYYLFAQVYDPQTLTGGLAAAWTLCVEISFYALLPLYAIALARLGRGRPRATRMRLELYVLGALAAASVGARAISLTSGGSTLEVTLAGTFAWFALGMALAVLSVQGAAAPRAVHAAARHPAACWTVAGVALVALAVVLHVPKDQVLAYSPREWMFQHVMSGVLAAALVLPAVLAPDRGGWPRRVMSWRALGLLGLVSYGIYLWQGAWVEQLARWDAIEWWSPFLTITLVTIVLTVVTAAASYLLLERPLMRLKDRPRQTSRRGTRRTGAGQASVHAPVPDTAPGSPR
jgi:peptidoglycan/LPS O-acetylase OafA/YrhL